METGSFTVFPADDRDQKDWNALVDYPLQTWEWGDFRKAMGLDVVRLLVKQGEKISQCWQLTFHSVPFSPYTVGYFPKGPMPDQFMIDELTKLGKQKKAIFIQLEPNIGKISSTHLPSSSAPNLVPSHHPLFTKYTFIIDLTKSEEELLQRMHSKTRYNIRVAQKHGVVIKEDNSDKAFERYLALSRSTTERQGFYAHNPRYHQTMWHAMRKSGIAKLFTAEFKQEVLSAWIIFCWRDTIYYPYGASSRSHREVMAPNLLLWELIRWGKSHGFKKFDLWGALGPEPNAKDPWYGFHRFKEGYKPELVEFTGSYDLVIHPMLYKLYCIGDSIRWGVLRLKSNLKIFKF